MQLIQQKSFVLLPHWVIGRESSELMCELAQGTADAVVFLVVGGVLDGVAAEDGRVAVVVVAGVGGEVDLSEELLLVVLEFADHLVLRCVVVRFGLGLKIFVRRLIRLRDFFGSVVPSEKLFKVPENQCSGVARFWSPG